MSTAYNRNYLNFITAPPKKSFKKLFIGTILRKALVKMNEKKAIPKGLQDEQVERGKN